MSMPNISAPENPIVRNQSVSDLIESVALIETGLSHIINAEGEKIQKAIKYDDPTAEVVIDDIIKVNNSAEKMINTISKLEMILQSKLETSKELDQSAAENINSGAIIPYSGQAYLSNDGDGLPMFGAAIAFQSGSEAYRVSLNGNVEQIALKGSIATYPLSRDGTINSISVYYDVPIFQSMSTETQIIARVYQAEIGTQTFYPVENAIVYLQPIIPAFRTQSMILHGSITNINAEIKASSKILLLVYAVAGHGADIRGEIGASINIL